MKHMLTQRLPLDSARRVLLTLQLFAIAGDSGTLAAHVGQRPAKPTNCVATNIGGYVLVAWTDNSNNEDGFTVGEWDARGHLIGSVDVPEDRTSYVLYPRGDRYRVRAYNGYGASGWSNWATP